MKKSINLFKLLAIFGAMMALAGFASAQDQPFRFAGTAHTTLKSVPARGAVRCGDPGASITHGS